MPTVTENLAARAAGVPGAIVDTTMGAIATVVARLKGLGGTVAEENAWAAVCSDRARRREWAQAERSWDGPTR
jgi:hypothetical protein